MKLFYFSSLSIVLLIAISSFRTSTSEPDIAFPDGYRDWTHVKTYVVLPKSPAFKMIGGFNHVYANDLALVGYRTGRFPDGSIIVSDVVQAQHDSLNVREGQRHHIDVMVKDSVKYAAIGGWAFETFAGSSAERTLNTSSRAQCTNCHRKQTDFVFSDFRK